MATIVTGNTDPVYGNNALGLSMAVGAIASGANVKINGCVTGGKYVFDGKDWSRADGKVLEASDTGLIDQLKASRNDVKTGVAYDLKGVSGALISVDGEIMAGGIVEVQSKIDMMSGKKGGNNVKDWLMQIVNFLFRR